MPWNEQKGGGGPWGGSGGGSGGSGGNGGGPGGGSGGGPGDKSPWGRPNKPQGSGGGGGGGGDKPDLEESIRRMQERFRRRGGGGNGRSGGSGGRPARGFGTTGVLIVIAVAFIGWLMTGIYTVNEQEAAVVLRFGKPDRTELAGFHVRFPSPIEEQLIVPVNRSQLTEIGLNESESLMLTRDGNIIDVDFAINWKINSPEKYLFKVVDKPNNDPNAPNELIRQVGESAMREVVGNADFIPLITSGRGDVEGKVLKIMQDVLASYDAGVDVISISLKKSAAPPDVADAQRDVSGAQQEREKRNNEGYSYLNKVVNEAQGEALRIKKEADGYRDSTIALSTGEAAGFDKVYQEYRKSPESKRVTRERIFLETMEKVIGRSNRIIVDTKTGTVPVLPLDTLRPRQQQ